MRDSWQRLQSLKPGGLRGVDGRREVALAAPGGPSSLRAGAGWTSPLARPACVGTRGAAAGAGPRDDLPGRPLRAPQAATAGSPGLVPRCHGGGLPKRAENSLCGREE